MLNKQDHGVFFSVGTAAATLAVASFAAPSGAVAYISDIAVSATTSVGTWALIAGATPTNGTITLWTGNGTAAQGFTTPLGGWAGGKISLEANGTGTVSSNISGFYI